jgi:sugar phosphate isomerase/epimerase
MKVGVADYGINVWEGGCFDFEERLRRLQGIGYDGTERLEAISADDALTKAAMYRRMRADFGTCRGPNPQCSIRWTAGLGKAYTWVTGGNRDLGTFCRQANAEAAACERAGIRAALHNHLGTAVENQAQLDDFMERCPTCTLLLDTAHLAAAGGDPVGSARRYADRIIAVHVKDWKLLDAAIGLDRWGDRLRFCELGAGEMGDANAEVVRVLRAAGFDGWFFVEHDTHLRDPYEDLAVSREYLRKAGL